MSASTQDGSLENNVLIAEYNPLTSLAITANTCVSGLVKKSVGFLSKIASPRSDPAPCPRTLGLPLQFLPLLPSLPEDSTTDKEYRALYITMPVFSLVQEQPSNPEKE